MVASLASAMTVARSAPASKGDIRFRLARVHDLEVGHQRQLRVSRANHPQRPHPLAEDQRRADLGDINEGMDLRQHIQRGGQFAIERDSQFGHASPRSSEIVNTIP